MFTKIYGLMQEKIFGSYQWVVWEVQAIKLRKSWIVVGEEIVWERLLRRLRFEERRKRIEGGTRS